jgi:hypothetical protein
MSDNNWLLDAIDKLTLNHFTKVLQERNGISCISDVDHEPLLRQLRDAVGSSTGSKGAASDGSARIPFNPTALALFDDIADRINAWYRELPAAVEERYIWDRLRDWYTDFENRRRAGKVTDTTEHVTLKLVEGWVRSIEAMFDPPTTLELTEQILHPTKTDTDGKPAVIGHRPAGCPMCGERYAHDPRTGDQITAIIIEYRNIGAETLDKATGLCRFCTTVWRGRTGLRELRWAVDHPEEKEHDTPSEAA